MARGPTAKQRIRGLLDDFEPKMRDAFTQSIEGIKSNIVLARLEEAIKSGDIDAAARAINLDASAFRPFDKAASDVFEAGGNEAGKKVPNLAQTNGPSALFRFDVHHPTAARDLREYSSFRDERMTEDQRQMLRDTLADGISQGRSPRRTALDIAGRMNAVTGRREGGLVGLSAPQARYVENMRQRLLSGDKTEMKKVFDMARRDKRFDASIRKAIAAGKPLDKATVDRMTMRYADRLLLLRGETIARTETMTAFNKGQMAAMQQAVDEGRVSASVIVKIWHAFIDGRTRFTHQHLNNKSVPFNSKFITARGAQLMYPGDPEGGADEIVCCRCWMETKIDFLAGLM